MKFYLGDCESASCAIRRISCELRARMRDIIGDETLDADAAVLGLRKCVKKQRAILRFSQSHLKPSVFRRSDRALRNFSRGVGSTRDSAVLVKTFDSLMEHYHPLLSIEEMLPVRQALQNRHVLAMAKYQEHRDLQRLESAFNKLEHKLDRMAKAKLSRGQVKSALRDVYGLGRKRYQLLGLDPSTGNSHRLRSQARHLWYQLRTLRKWLSEGSLAVTKDLQALARLLGQDSDMAVLIDTLMANPGICSSRVRVELICSLAESRRIALLSASLRLAERIYAHKPNQFINDLFSMTE